MFKLNTVPSPRVPPPEAVPYSVSPDNARLASGRAPSLFVPDTVAGKVCTVAKFMPSVPILKIVPPSVVPYSVPPDNTRPAIRKGPIGPPLKL